MCILGREIYCFIKNKLFKLGSVLVRKIKDITLYSRFWDLHGFNSFIVKLTLHLEYSHLNISGKIINLHSYITKPYFIYKYTSTLTKMQYFGFNIKMIPMLHIKMESKHSLEFDTVWVIHTKSQQIFQAELCSPCELLACSLTQVELHCVYKSKSNTVPSIVYGVWSY